MNMMKKGLFLGLMVFLGTYVFAQDLPNTNEVPENASEANVPEADVPAGIVPEDIVPAQNIPDDDAPEEDVPDENAPIEIEPSFMLSGTGGNIRFIQRLSWQEAQYAVRYSVLLERKNEELDTFAEVLRRNLDADINYIDVSVPAGEYRYRVYSFNILGQLDTQTEWEYFLVLRAIQPSIVVFTPEAFYLDRATPRILYLTGENLLPDTEIFLVSQNLFDENGEFLKIIPREIYLNELGETARLIFDEEDLVAGRYEILARNPGGLENRINYFSVAIAKPYDINVSGGFTPSLTLVGQKTYFLDHVFVPLSFSARGSFVPFKFDFGFIGAEFNPSYIMLTSTPEETGLRSTAAHLVIANFNALYQYWLIRNELSLNGRAGIGIAGLFDYHFEYSTGRSGDSYSAAAFSINVGASVQWFFYKQIYAEGGLDYNHIIHSEFNMGFVRIGLFCGYQF